MWGDVAPGGEKVNLDRYHTHLILNRLASLQAVSRDLKDLDQSEISMKFDIVVGEYFLFWIHCEGNLESPKTKALSLQFDEILKKFPMRKNDGFTARFFDPGAKSRAEFWEDSEIPVEKEDFLEVQVFASKVRKFLLHLKSRGL
jgi:hypothetical protein